MISRFQENLRSSCLLALFLCFCQPRILAADPPRDKAIRAVLLFHLAQLTEWPKEAFADDSDPFIIGVAGEDPFGDVLEAAVKGELVRGRTILIERYRTPAEVKKPHLLYISSSEIRVLPEVLRTVETTPALTVSDMERAERRGVMVRLYWEDGRAKMIINRDAVSRKGLVMSPRLLSVAQAYPDGRLKPSIP